LSLIYYEMNF